MATKAKKAYDVVVIGAGNGGLVAAIRILQAGYSCLLLEKHNLPTPETFDELLEVLAELKYMK